MRLVLKILQYVSHTVNTMGADGLMTQGASQGINNHSIDWVFFENYGSEPECSIESPYADFNLKSRALGHG